ncbi:hypothetical protein N566_26505 [Streptomycetaceae bacterium MP113-05]|nr:hypothetical protein N566_26505 [Streptomycetaceae bacterium MP113-05]
MSLADHAAAVELLLAVPGPRTADLDVGEEFSGDDGTALLSAQEAFTTDCEALVALLSRRWGEPELIDLTDDLVRRAQGEPVPEPVRTLCAYVRVLHRWRVADRWLGVGVGRQGDELPFHLVAAVGDIR